MFNLANLPTPWNGTALLLLATIGVLLVVGFLRFPYRIDRRGRMPLVTQLPQTFLLILLALIIWISGVRGTTLQSLGLLVVLGIIWGFLGDLLMADVFGQKDHDLYGMVAFALGHIFYMLGFREIVLVFSLYRFTCMIASLVIMWIAAILIWRLMIRNPAGDPFMQRVALGYALFLATMAGFALGIALQRATFWPMAIGGMLFVFSDALIAAQMFGERKFPYQGDLIWLTYIIAQVLIVTAVPAALGAL